MQAKPFVHLQKSEGLAGEVNSP
jgi:hypothetical protein